MTWLPILRRLILEEKGSSPSRYLETDSDNEGRQRDGMVNRTSEAGVSRQYINRLPLTPVRAMCQRCMKTQAESKSNSPMNPSGPYPKLALLQLMCIRPPSLANGEHAPRLSSLDSTIYSSQGCSFGGFHNQWYRCSSLVGQNRYSWQETGSKWLWRERGSLGR